MYPHERSLTKKLKDKPFALLGVNSDSKLDEIQKIVKDKEITWRSFWNGPDGTSGPISKRWDVSGWPTLYIIDAKGVIRHKQLGGNPVTLDAAIEKLLAEMGHKVSLSDDHDEEEDDDPEKEKTETKKEEKKDSDDK